MYVISSRQAAQLLLGLAEVSLDLGMSTTKVSYREGSVVLPDGQSIPLADIKKIDDNCCYLIEDRQLKKITQFSDETQLFYKLYPTESAPTIEISGIRMHRTTERNPWQDTQDKIASISPVKGRVLDTCTGLGYTAIMAARTAEEVISVEVDENVRTIASFNPWSAELFSNKRIKLPLGDIQEDILAFTDKSFDCIIHDPPSFKIAGELYSGVFYQQLYRVLKPAGKLYHYTGNPGSRSSGQDVSIGVMKRLAKAGFTNIIRHEQALGIIARR